MPVWKKYPVVFCVASPAVPWSTMLTAITRLYSRTRIR
jgi:hypothetical protein